MGSKQSLPPQRLPALLLAAVLLVTGTAPAAERVRESYEEAMGQGALAARKGDYPRALARFKEARRLEPRSAEARYRLALTYCDLKFYAEAEQHARKAVILDDQLAGAWLVLGTALFYLDREKEADTALATALRLAPENPHITYMRGRCNYYLGAKLQRQAAAQRRQAHETEEASREDALRQAREASRQAQTFFHFALKSFERTLQLDGTYTEAHFMMGCCFLDLDFPDNARDSFILALKAEPNNPEVHLRLGLCYLRANRPLEAERSFREVLRFDVDHVEARLLLGDLYTRDMPDPEEARLHYRRFLAGASDSHPAVPRVRRALGGEPPD